MGRAVETFTALKGLEFEADLAPFAGAETGFATLALIVPVFCFGASGAAQLVGCTDKDRLAMATV